MKLTNAIIRPGVIIQVLEDGKIKAKVPGLFMEEDKESNPPILPFCELYGFHANNFSTPVVNEPVWVINVTDNPRELYWFRKDNHIENNKAIFEEGGKENVEIICNRQGANGWATMYFSDGSGWIIRNNESVVHILDNGDIDINTNKDHRKITIDSEAIKLGNGEHPGALADFVQTRLEEICDLLLTAAKAANSYPETMTLSPIFNRAQLIKEKIPEILSQHIKLD